MGLARVQWDKEVDYLESSHESHETSSTLDFSGHNSIGRLSHSSIQQRARQRNRGPKAKNDKMLFIPAFGGCNLYPICLVDNDLTALASPRKSQLYRHLVFSSLLYSPRTCSSLGSMVSEDENQLSPWAPRQLQNNRTPCGEFHYPRSSVRLLVLCYLARQ